MVGCSFRVICGTSNLKALDSACVEFTSKNEIKHGKRTVIGSKGV